MAFVPTLLIGSNLLALGEAYSVFETSCTSPNTTVSYVSSPNTRGSMDIVWSCFGTLFACIYSILHFNVSPREEHLFNEAERRFWRSRLYSKVLLSSYYACFTLIGPEWVCLIALTEWWQARQQLQLLHESMPGTRGDWTLVHMLFANMGGFVLLYKHPILKQVDSSGEEVRLISQDEKPAADDKRPADDSKPPSTRAAEEVALSASELDAAAAKEHSKDEVVETAMTNTKDSLPRSGDELNIVQSRGQVDTTQLPESAQDPDAKEEKNREQYFRYHVNARHLRKAVELGLLSSKATSLEDITDRSKSDLLAKLLVILQLTDFFVGVLARLAEGLAISPLEVAVSAFALCSIVAYGFLLYKPKNVETPLVLAIYENLPEAIDDLNGRSKRLRRTAETPEGTEPRIMRYWSRPAATLDIPDASDERVGSLVLMSAAGGLFATFFGAIHLAGWYLTFPSVVDQWLWRSASIVATAGPLLGLVLHIPALLVDRKYHITGGFDSFLSGSRLGPPSKTRSPVIMIGYVWMARGLVVVVAVAYFFARLILIVEMFRTLFYLPPSAFLTPSWSIDIPHIS